MRNGMPARRNAWTRKGQRDTAHNSLTLTSAFGGDISANGRYEGRHQARHVGTAAQYHHGTVDVVLQYRSFTRRLRRTGRIEWTGGTRRRAPFAAAPAALPSRSLPRLPSKPNQTRLKKKRGDAPAGEQGKQKKEGKKKKLFSRVSPSPPPMRSMSDVCRLPALLSDEDDDIQFVSVHGRANEKIFSTIMALDGEDANNTTTIPIHTW